MRNADYWRQRARINSDAAHADANEYIAQLEDIYREAVMSVQADLDRWYGRFADNNQITLAEAKKRLTEGELEEFHWSVDKYIKAAEENGLDPAWQKKLENASARYHISRLEAIQMQIQQQAELVYGNQMDGLDELLRRIADNGYNHAAFDAMKGLGIGWDFTKLDQKRLDAMLKKPWTSDGKTFTDRCWEGKADLIDGIQRELVQSLMRGDSLAKTRDRIADRFHAWVRLGRGIEIKAFDFVRVPGTDVMQCVVAVSSSAGLREICVHDGQRRTIARFDAAGGHDAARPYYRCGVRRLGLHQRTRGQCGRRALLR